MTQDFSNIRLFLVGGAVRDYLINENVRPKDFDFSVEAHSFDQMREWLVSEGFTIFLETPQYLTIRAKLPRDWSFAGFEMSGLTYDFVLCRRDGAYSDGRRPDEVVPGSIFDDLSRRDFTMNAIAIDKGGYLIDPFSGAQDIQDGLIRCVGSIDRLKEDGLRVLRAIRFYVQTGFDLHEDIDAFISSPECLEFIRNVSLDRVRDEIHKAFKSNAYTSILTFADYPHVCEEIFEGDLWLKPTSEKR